MPSLRIIHSPSPLATWSCYAEYALVYMLYYLYIRLLSHLDIILLFTFPLSQPFPLSFFSFPPAVSNGFPFSLPLASPIYPLPLTFVCLYPYQSPLPVPSSSFLSSFPDSLLLSLPYVSSLKDFSRYQYPVPCPWHVVYEPPWFQTGGELHRYAASRRTMVPGRHRDPVVTRLPDLCLHRQELSVHPGGVPRGCWDVQRSSYQPVWPRWMSRCPHCGG